MMKFTFDYIKKQYQAALDAGYEVITCADYVDYKKSGKNGKLIINRIDIDLSVLKAGVLVDLFNDLEIKGSFFLRLHAPEYNPFSFQNYKIINRLVKSGHELGYHSEIVDQAEIWSEDAADCLIRDIDIINRMFNTRIRGVASHGGYTGLNNLDFWKDRKPADFGLDYEGYDRTKEYGLFNNSFYISDSEWIRWKCYNNGVMVNNDERSIAEHVKDNHPLIYLLIHPDTYYHHNKYEND